MGILIAVFIVSKAKKGSIEITCTDDGLDRVLRTKIYEKLQPGSFKECLKDHGEFQIKIGQVTCILKEAIKNFNSNSK